MHVHAVMAEPGVYEEKGAMKMAATADSGDLDEESGLFVGRAPRAAPSVRLTVHVPFLQGRLSCCL
jgi:hypothetical protein